MELLEHFSHEHPLILNEAQKDVKCRGCNESIVIGDSVYSCSISNTSDNRTEDDCDDFFLHKTCAELPRELEHRMHQDHRLRLQSRPQKSTGSVCFCDACRNFWAWFTYQCLSCKFNLCFTCVLQDRSFHHEANNHPLTIMPMVATFRCHACDAEAKDFSYFCTTCQFWIHKSCASAPTTLKCEFHKDHPLVLAHFLPEQYRSFRFGQPCSICKEEVRPNYWLYYCADCRFFSHIRCATSTKTVEPSRSIDEVDDLNLVHFPMPDETSLSSLINQFVKDLSLADDSSRPADQISHWAHEDHPLVLCDQSNSEMKYDEMLCDGCVRPLSVDAFYGCVQCNFFLHRFCVELPKKLEHPSHPQHSLLIDYKGSHPRKVFLCNFCERWGNGIYFRCESCDFSIDMVCASLPGKIKHESHEHPLNQLQIDFVFRCDASGIYFDFGFGCETCSFYLSTHCAVNMPTKIRHRWDPHPLHLLYHPVKGHPHEFDCERCSDDIDPNCWFYHCRDCDLSFHMECFRDDSTNIKYGAIIKVDDHQHSLALVPIKWKRVCSGCNRDIPVGDPALECAPCKYLLCIHCY